jgi:hypothetical protein
MRCGLISLTFAISIVPVVANAQLTIDMGNWTWLCIKKISQA